MINLHTWVIFCQSVRCPWPSAEGHKGWKVDFSNVDFREGSRGRIFFEGFTLPDLAAPDRRGRLKLYLLNQLKSEALC